MGEDVVVSKSDRKGIVGERSSIRLAILGGITVILLAAAHSIHDIYEGMPAGHSFLLSIPLVLEVFALSAGHFFARRHKLKPGVTTGLAIAICILFGCGTVLLHSGWSEEPLGAVVAGVFVGAVVFGLWYVIFRVPAILYEARIRSMEARNLKKELELARLRSSLRPHFLLNTLNAVAGLVTSEPTESRRMLTALGDLLRDSLEEGPEIRPLEEDIAWLKHYTEILEIRHRGSLSFNWDIEPEALKVPLPRFLLQPLIENASMHGALCRGQDGKVTVSAGKAGGLLRIVVEDNGPGMKDGVGEGLGIRLVRERLSLAGAGASFRIESSPDGTRAVIEVPWAEGKKP